jgi:hypothetical protein
MRWQRVMRVLAAGPCVLCLVACSHCRAGVLLATACAVLQAQGQRVHRVVGTTTHNRRCSMEGGVHSLSATAVDACRLRCEVYWVVAMMFCVCTSCLKCA